MNDTNPIVRRDNRGCNKRLLTKTVLIMKLTTIFLLAAVLQVGAKGFGQNVTLSVKDAPLEKVLNLIKKQTGLSFLWDEQAIKKTKPVTLDVKSMPLKQVMDACVKDQGLTYDILQNLVVIKNKPNVTVEENTAANNPPNLMVTGKVASDKGEPIEAASVVIKGTKRGITTDAMGNFTLKDVDKDAVLVFSSIGFENLEVRLNNRVYLSVILKTKVNEISSVVVSTGYQDLKKISVAGSTSTVKASDLYFTGTNTIEQALQGKLPGVVVINNDGLVGTRQKTIVRGVSTLTGTQDPVWVVDGVIQTDPLPFKPTTLNALGAITPDNFDYVRNFVGNAIGWLNPNDIEDITVLKDASATAIYGVRAANGVIVINTKKGKEGPSTVSYSFSVNTAQKVSYDRLELMNSKDRVAVSKEIFDRGLTSNATNNNIGYAGALNDYLFGRITYEQFNAKVKYLETVNVNWFDILFRNPISTNHNISISGGNANTRYYSSFGYNSTNGTAIGNQSKGFTANFNLNTRLSRKLSASFKIAASQKNTDGFYKTDPYSYATSINRAIPAYDSIGGNFYYTDRTGYLYNVNNELANSTSSNKSLTVNASVNINYDIAKGIRFTSLASVNQTQITGQTTATERTAYIAYIRGYNYGAFKATDVSYRNSRLPIGGEYNEDDNNNLTWNWRNSLSYSHVFNMKHTLIVSLGQEANSSRYTGLASTNYGYLPERGKAFALVPSVIGATTTFANALYTSTGVPTASGSTTMFKNVITDRLTNNVGFYLTANYTYDNRYAANFSIRSDASNRFGQFTGEKFNPVYAGGLRWNAMYEKWMTNKKWLSTLSLRATFGYQRNIVTNVSPDLIAQIPTSPASTVTDLFTGDPRLLVGSLPYGNLRWEKNATFNFGLDFGFFKNRVSGSFEYYIKKGTDLITTLAVPVEYGVTSMPVNGGNLTNRGLELSFNFIPIQTKNSTLNISLNSSKTYNELTNVGTQNPSWRVAASGNLYVKGNPISGFWAFDFQGIDPANGFPKISLTTDASKNAATDPTAYMKYMGKLNPDFVGGLGISYRYKMFTISTNTYLQIGGKKFLSPSYSVPFSTAANSLPSEYDNMSTQLNARWTPQNTNAEFPGLPDTRVANFLLPDGKTFSNVYEMYNYSTARVVNASTLRVNSINLNYSLPLKIVSFLKVKNINAGAGVSNPFAIVSKDFKGRDAEVATGSQPRTASYTVNMNITF